MTERDARAMTCATCTTSSSRSREPSASDRKRNDMRDMHDILVKEPRAERERPQAQ
jgi:hypothetical protein